MNNPSRLSAYAQSAAVVMPAAVAALFAALFLTPKLQQLWRDSGANLPSLTTWVVSASELIVHHWLPIIAFALAILMALEFRFPVWDRFRRPAMLSAAILFNTIVLAGLIAMIVGLVLLMPATTAR